MNDVLQSIAHLLNASTDEVKSIVDVSKENLPKLYVTLVREHALYDIVTNLGLMTVIPITISLMILMSTTMSPHISDKSRRQRLIWSSVAMALSIIAACTCVILRPICSPNYMFLLDIMKK